MKIKAAVLLILISYSAFSQSGITWEPAINIASSSYENHHPRICLNGKGEPVVLWGKLATNFVYTARWDSAQGTFAMPVPVNTSAEPSFVASWAGPDIASFGDTIYAVYKVTPEDTGRMFCARSIDGGISFSQGVEIPLSIGNISRFVTATTDSIGNPIVAYMKFDQMFMNPQYVVSRSNDFGMTFSTDAQASGYSGGNVCDCCPASVVSSGNTIATLARDNLNNLRTIWTGVSTDGGQTFPNGLSVDHSNWMYNACPSTGPDGVIIGDSLYAVFMSGGTQCFLNKSSLSTMNSGLDISLGAMPSGLMQNYPRIAHDGKRVAVVCIENLNGQKRIPLFYSEDITTTPLSQSFDTIASGNQYENADIAMDEKYVYVVWENTGTGTVKFRRGLLPDISTGVNKISSDEFLVFPSPAKDHFSVTCKGKIKSIELVDINGKKIKLTSDIRDNEATCRFDAAAGNYSIIITTENRKYYTRTLGVTPN